MTTTVSVFGLGYVGCVSAACLANEGFDIIGVDVNLRDKGVIALVVESTDGALAAETANLYFQVLDRVILRLGEQATRRQENFYADQLQRAAKEVTTAEEAVLRFQAENRVVQVDAPARGAVTEARRCSQVANHGTPAPRGLNVFRQAQ